MTLAALAGVVWATQALRQLDLVTAKGQTIVQFIGITMLAMPFLVLVVAPFALLIALVIVLNSLSADSELIVINASGASRGIILRPVLVFSALVSVGCGLLALQFAPAALAQLRDEITRVRVDLVANIVRPGRFIEVEDGLTFHIRDRSGDGQLDGLLLHDERDPETIFTYEAARGHIVEAVQRTLLVMQDGTIQRRTREDGAISIVRFQSYAFDLSNVVPESSAPVYKASERSLADLLDPADDDAYAQEHRARLVAEVHDRLSQPIYPIAFGLIVFAFLGEARTTRQNRATSLLGAMAACILLRTAGFGALTLVAAYPAARFGLYAVPLAGAALAIWSILSTSEPAWLRRARGGIERIAEMLERMIERRRHGEAA